MMRRYRLNWFMIVLTLLSAAPASGAIQVESSGVPMDLAIALLGGQGPGTAIFVGAVPPEIDGRIPLGQVQRVVGGLAQRRGGTVIVEVSGDARQALTDYREHLQEQGWTRPPPRGNERGGFQQTNQFSQNTWCGEGYSIRGSSLTLDSGTYLRLSYTSREAGRTVCDAVETGARRPMDPLGRMHFPVLEPLPGAVVRGGGGGGSSGDINTSASVETELPLEVLFEHYAQQLTAAGWIPEGRSIGDGVSIGRWRAQDDAGEPVVGTLAAWTLLSENSYRVWARMDRPDRRR